MSLNIIFEKNGNKLTQVHGVVKANEIYTPNAYFICDRSLNKSCPRVKNNEPCGDCKGTTNMEFAKIF